MKKSLMMAIEKYGYYVMEIHNNTQFGLVLDIDKNESYLGVSELCDNTIHMLSNAKSIICNIIVSSIIHINKTSK